MLRLAIVFFVIGVVAAIFGFTEIAGAAMGIARFIFFIFVALFVVTLVLALLGGGTI